MIWRLGRLLGFTVLGAWLDRQPPLLAALGRLILVLAVFTPPVILAATGVLGYGEIYWWLWLDAFVVGIWTMVALGSRRTAMAPFFFIHYMLMFTVLPGVLVAFLFPDPLAPQTAWWVIGVLGLASLVLHGWITRHRWYPPTPEGRSGMNGGEITAAMLVPYLRLAVVYAGLFIPLSIPGIPDGDNRPIPDWAVVRAAVILAAVKLALELILALIHLWRTRRSGRVVIKN